MKVQKCHLLAGCRKVGASKSKLVGSFVHVDCRTKQSCVEHAYVFSC